MGVSKNRGTPKWMVDFMENPMNKRMIWGVPLFLETPIYTWHDWIPMNIGMTILHTAMRSHDTCPRWLDREVNRKIGVELGCL